MIILLFFCDEKMKTLFESKNILTKSLRFKKIGIQLLSNNVYFYIICFSSMGLY